MASSMHKSRTFGEADYRQGAFERLAESNHLRSTELLAGRIYLAGRGVEGMLRAVVWRNDSDIRTGKKSLETGHDLAQLLTQVERLGLLQQNDRDDEFRTRVQTVARLWFNNMRFASRRKVELDWRSSRDVGKRRTLKKAADDYYDSCSEIVRRCEKLL